MPLSSRKRIVVRIGHTHSSAPRIWTETSWLADDPPEEPSAFEAWIGDLQPASVEDEIHASAHSERRDSALTLHATLRRRAKLARGLLLVATIGLPLVLLLSAIQASTAGHRVAARGSPSHPLAVKDRALAPWLAGARGRGPAAGTLDVQPASMNGDVVYACWVESPSGPGASGPTPLHLAVSGDGAYTWRPLSSPVPRATACHLVADNSDARRIAFLTQLDTINGAGCSLTRMFASGDGGTRWSAVSLPHALAGVCGLALSSTSGTLVLWTNSSTSIDMPADTRLWISLDSGATWRSVGTSLPGGSVESVVSARADGALLVLLRRAEAGPAASELWSCPSGCPGWQRVSMVPGSAPSVAAGPSGWLPPGEGWGTLYAMDSVPLATDSLYVSSATQPGAWRQLPLLPWSADASVPSGTASPSRMLAVGPDGSLVLESQRAAVTLAPSGATEEQAAVGLLSMWDPTVGGWLAPLLIEPAGSTVLAAVWDEQGANAGRRLTIWFETRSGDIWPVVVPSGDWQGSQAAVRCQRCG